MKMKLKIIPFFLVFAALSSCGDDSAKTKSKETSTVKHIDDLR